jgi:hypothetical protein
MIAALPIREADKRQALEQVLQSVTFLRANQVRNFLRYICEMEFAGRGATLHEYLIGVEALGRPTAYSTDEDSSVRRRAFALRCKLEEVYANELAHAQIRIHVPKGSYVPVFLPNTPAMPVVDDAAGRVSRTRSSQSDRERKAS